MKPLNFKFPYNTELNEERRLNDITAELLLRWLDKYLNPKKWLIELTGGEPLLHPEIDEILKGLEKRGYQGIVKTNGSIKVSKIKGFIFLAAWHLGQDFPLVYDTVSIIKNDRDDWRGKISHCKKNNIPYVTADLNEEYVTGKTFDDGLDKTHYLLEYLYMNSLGQVQECPPHNEGDAHRIHELAWKEPSDMTKANCAKCYHAFYGTRHMAQEAKEKIKADWGAYHA
jgi:MoaA/NifB/PqqE/SkfB family radical SAM enzyme